MANKRDYEFKDLTKSQLDCLAIVEGLGIYELRALARVFGDNSPSTLKRDEHIKTIMAKIISGEDLRPIPLRQGRPYKELSNIQGILEELSRLTGKDYVSANIKQMSQNRSQSEIFFNQAEDDVVSKQLFPIKAKGTLCKNSNGDYFFYNQHNLRYVMVKREMCENLKLFDFVEGTAVLMNNSNEYALSTLDKVNFQNVKTYVETLEPYKKTVPTEKIDVDKSVILLGGRFRFNNLTNFVEKKDVLSKLVKKLRSKNIRTLAVIPNVLEEQISDIESIGFDNALLFKYDEKSTEIFNAILTINDYVKRQQELGGSVAIFLQDAVTIFNLIDFCFKSQPKNLFGHTEKTVEYIRELGGLVMAGENGKSTTCFVSCDSSDMFDPLYISLIYKVYKPIEL